ncbi:MAG: serine hydrolase [Gemmatimonadales bacterium]
MIRVVTVLLAVVAVPRGALGQQPRTFANFTGFDRWVTATMAEWHVPGLAVAAIKDGQIVLAKGYGYRDVETREPVTPRTVMAIGSNSKSFTVVLMGMLVDEKKLAWDTPVRSYLPEFEMWDEVATREMTPRDLVTHRSGLPRHDNLWYGRAFSRPEMFRRLRYLEPSAAFRSRYQYQNLMFMTAGYLTERIAGRSWDELIRDRIFAPLEMARSNTTVRESPGTGDFAYPYTWRHDSLERLPFRNIDAIGPAGSINSTVLDMMKYLEFRINLGEAGRRRLLSVANEREMQSPQMAISATPEFLEIGHSAYGLGLNVGSYRGRKVVGHGGGIDGFVSAMAWLPNDRIGVMVLTNLSGNNPVPGLVQRQVFDRLLGVAPIDWVSRQRRLDREALARVTETRAARSRDRKLGTSPTHPLSDYVGRYEHPGYGTVTVSHDGDGLRLGLERTTVRLRHYHYDVWELDDPGGVVPFGGLVEFLATDGVVDRVAVPLEPNLGAVTPVTGRPRHSGIIFGREPQ